ncbi:hypothetical protein CEXT_592191 [Caerostris extrusa]|uniref:Uncharacterized protein n=1 Tax=Caerostris extrusa TaxID=172846 RepID=A0AAV4P8K1_CAEEX|nr:hypothetical protein CEXT_592191 [Caerostris extrusa]
MIGIYEAQTMLKTRFSLYKPDNKPDKHDISIEWNDFPLSPRRTREIADLARCELYCCITSSMDYIETVRNCAFAVKMYSYRSEQNSNITITTKSHRDLIDLYNIL